jgi:RNA polymerase sigma-70 factor (ECF subfamily)
MISRKEIAEEAAQEVWLEVIKSMPSYKKDSKLSTWIYIIAIRVVSRYAIQENHYSTEFLHDYITGEDRDIPDDIDVDREEWIKEECDRCLTGLFHCLSNDARFIYIFREIMQLPYNEVAVICGKSEQDIRQSISRTRTKLRNFLNRNCRIFNPCSSCKCRMTHLIEDINLPTEYQKIRETAKHISILRQADMILPQKNYWEKYI